MGVWEAEAGGEDEAGDLRGSPWRGFVVGLMNEMFAVVGMGKRYVALEGYNGRGIMSSHWT